MAPSEKYPGETALEQYPPTSHRAPLAVAAWPDRYHTGMSNLGFQFIYSELAGSGSFRVERQFADKDPIRGADFIFFSVSYEEDIFDLVRMLAADGIEPLRENREDGPLVVAGGPVISSNPLPFYPIADILCAGEGEGILPAVIDALADHGRDKAAIARALVNTAGILMPGHIEKTGPAASVDPMKFQRSVILTPDTVFPNTMLIEISRGCPGSCAFCMATSIYSPFRVMPIGKIMEYVDVAEDMSGPGFKVGLVSTAAAAHPGFVEILDSIVERGGAVSLSSLRAVDIDRAKAEAIGRAGIRSVSLAPESGSEKARFDLGKKVPDTRFFEAGRLLHAQGVGRFNLYMLTGYPGEDGKVFEETARFLESFVESVKGARVSVNLNALVPKPRTPLRHMPMAHAEDIRASAEALRSACRAAGAGIAVKGLRSALDQARISLGSERTGRAAVRSATGDTSWKKALRDEGIDPDFIHEKRDPDNIQI